MFRSAVLSVATRCARFLPGLALAAAATGPAMAQTLRPEVRVEADQVRLGDLFAGLATQADVVVAPTPQPGYQIVFDAAHLTKLAEAYDLPWRPSSDGVRSVVTRSGELVTVDAMRQIVVDALAERLRVSAHALEVTLDGRTTDVRLANGQAAHPTVGALEVEPNGNRFAAVVVPTGSADTGPEVRLTGRFVQMIQVPVLTRRVAPGEIITVSDIDWVQVREERSHGDMVTNAEQMLGHTPRRGLIAGQPIRARDVEMPLAISRNDTITIVFQTRTLSLTARGRALSDGKVGQTIRVTNVQSNRTVDAVVSGPGVVRVSPLQPPSLALN